MHPLYTELDVSTVDSTRDGNPVGTFDIEPASTSFLSWSGKEAQSTPSVRTMPKCHHPGISKTSRIVNNHPCLCEHQVPVSALHPSSPSSSIDSRSRESRSDDESMRIALCPLGMTQCNVESPGCPLQQQSTDPCIGPSTTQSMAPLPLDDAATLSFCQPSHLARVRATRSRELATLQGLTPYRQRHRAWP